MRLATTERDHDPGPTRAVEAARKCSLACSLASGILWKPVGRLAAFSQRYREKWNAAEARGGAIRELLISGFWVRVPVGSPAHFLAIAGKTMETGRSACLTHLAE